MSEKISEYGFVNVHAIAGPYAPANIRLFEASGAATCMLTDSKKDLHELFEIDDEIVTYSSIDECV